MARQNLENGATFAVQRSKLNSNFVEIYDWSDRLDTLEAEILGKQNSTSLTKTSYHTPSTTGVFNGQTIDSGQTPTVTGTGIATTVSSVDGFIHDPVDDNTYIFVNTGSPVKRVVQQFRGTQGVIAICLAGNANDMIHVEFPTSSTATCTYWKTAVGVAQPMTIGETVNVIPNLNDGVTHELAVEIHGDKVTAYVDDVCVGFWWDAYTSTIVGNWYYCQITDVTANCKIYGFSSYSEIPQSFSINAGSISAGAIQAQCIQIGREASASWAPDSSLYVLSESGDVFRIVGTTNSRIQLEALGAGHPAQIEFENSLAVTMVVGLGAANGHIQYQGNTVIDFIVNGFVSGVYYHTKPFTFEPAPSGVTIGTNGRAAIEMTSNTAGNIVYRGSDGTTRRFAFTVS